MKTKNKSILAKFKTSKHKTNKQKTSLAKTRDKKKHCRVKLSILGQVIEDPAAWIRYLHQP